jgi:hypothetical protein
MPARERMLTVSCALLDTCLHCRYSTNKPSGIKSRTISCYDAVASDSIDVLQLMLTAGSQDISCAVPGARVHDVVDARPCLVAHPSPQSTKCMWQAFI